MIIQPSKKSCPEQSHAALRCRQQLQPVLFIWTSKVSRLSQPKLIRPCKELGIIAASIWKENLKVLGKCMTVTPKSNRVSLNKGISLITILSNHTSQQFLQRHKTASLRIASCQLRAPAASAKLSTSSRKSLLSKSLVMKLYVTCPSLTRCVYLYLYTRRD